MTASSGRRRTGRTLLPRLNLISRMGFLVLTPVLFRALNFAFIWHSIYWGAITLVVLIWASFILISPILGRIGCGWVCFMGTIQDFASEQALHSIRWRTPLLWLRLISLLAFFSSALTFYFVRLSAGKVHGVTFSPLFLNMDFIAHYKMIWLYDAAGALILGLILDRRWICRNACGMGLLCAAGASMSRLIPVADLERCNRCGVCEEACPVRIPIRDSITRDHGLVTNAECLLCGKCSQACRRDAIRIRFVWNRRVASGRSAAGVGGGLERGY